MRRDDERLLRKVLKTDIPGKGKRERPKTRWKDATPTRPRARRWTGRCGEGRSATLYYWEKPEGKKKKTKIARFAMIPVTRRVPGVLDHARHLTDPTPIRAGRVKCTIT